MRVVILAPAAPGAISGNAVTIRRFARGLAARGVGVQVVDCTAPEAQVRAALAAAGPADVLHAYHGFKAGRFLVEGASARRVVLSFGGTDLNRDLDDPARGPVIRAACGRADALLAHGAGALETARAKLPEHAGKLRLVPKGIELGPPLEPPFDLLRHCGLEPGFAFVLPAGVRPVKDNLFPLEHMVPLLRIPGVRLVLVGPILDAAYGAKVQEKAADPELHERGHVRMAGQVPPEAMPDVYRAAHVVLNTSISEGFSNAIAEAMLAGCAILASDVPGNRAAIEHDIHGLLYRQGDGSDFVSKALKLARDPALRHRLGYNARARAEKDFSPGREIDALLEAYLG